MFHSIAMVRVDEVIDVAMQGDAMQAPEHLG